MEKKGQVTEEYNEKLYADLKANYIKNKKAKLQTQPTGNYEDLKKNYIERRGARPPKAPRPSQKRDIKKVEIEERERNISGERS